MLPIPGRPRAGVLNSDHAKRVLDETLRPFAPASPEKRSVLAHFEPHLSLISEPPEHGDRRAFNGQVLGRGDGEIVPGQLVSSSGYERVRLLADGSPAEWRPSGHWPALLASHTSERVQALGEIGIAGDAGRSNLKVCAGLHPRLPETLAEV